MTACDGVGRMVGVSSSSMPLADGVRRSWRDSRNMKHNLTIVCGQKKNRRDAPMVEIYLMVIDNDDDGAR